MRLMLVCVLLAGCAGSSDDGDPAADTGSEVGSDGTSDTGTDGANEGADGGADGMADGDPEGMPMAEWMEVESPTDAALTDLWGADSRDVWAVGREGTILRIQDGVAAAEATGVKIDFYAVWGSGAQIGDPLFVSGDEGWVFVFDGQDWKAEQLDAQVPLDGICGTSAADVWAMGTGVMMHFDGTSWTEHESGHMGDVWMLDDGAGWAIGAHENGAAVMMEHDSGAWNIHDAPVLREGDVLSDVWGERADHFWAVGAAGDGTGLILHFDGEAWADKFDPPTPMHGVWSVGTMAWAGTATGIYQVMNGDGAEVKLDVSINAIFGFAEDDVWAAGAEGHLFHRTASDMP